MLLMVDCETHPCEEISPFFRTKIVVRSLHAVTLVADVVHEPERGIGKNAFAIVILYDHGVAGDPNRLSQQRLGVLGVMQDIDEYGYVGVSLLRAEG